MPFSAERPVLIIGAGTGGLALAHGLRGAGIPVQVFERDRHRTGGLQGYRVGISPNGVRSLRACLPATLFDTFVATTARDYRAFTMCTERFAPLITFSSEHLMPTDDVIKDYSVSRMTLRQVLLSGLDDVVAFDKRFVRYDDHGDRVTAFFEDGSSVTGALLVGADGANSRIRKQYLPHATQTETGMIAIGGKQALTDEVRDMLPPGARNAMSMFFDTRGQLGILHPMEFPWRADRQLKDGIGDTDAELIRQWPGLLFDNTVDYVSWGVVVPRDLAPAGVLSMDGSQLQEVVVRDVMAGWHPTLLKLAEGSDPTTTFALGIRTSDPLDPWRPSRVTLLGDAIHTMTPGRGAGANTALRDAALIRDKLVEVRDAGADLLAAIGDYEQRMRTYSAVAVRESLEFMDDDGRARRPIIGPLSRFGMRTALRITDRVPPLKRRLAMTMQRVRDSELEPA
ncbi:FAD-dependent oxidoreductase [Pseudonocardia spinosispora]|uniref:FAD-dependent oxidoreductase n=1 Tax=Pseudonocardia spinosispora TaxID=103441 RepID=UPI00049134B1|nr:NAD(P)/FAD-dependent oxidoreductase [Pseudonocardia spinosispora]